MKGSGQKYIVATECCQDVAEATGLDLTILDTFEGDAAAVHRPKPNVLCNWKGDALEGTICGHPIMKTESSRLIPAEHVTADAGMLTRVIPRLVIQV